MLTRRVMGTVVAGVALGLASVPIASTAFAATNTKGLTSLSVQGVGQGALAGGDCAAVACPVSGECSCLSATDSLVGNQGFKGGQFTVQLSVYPVLANLPVLSNGDSCNPATGQGTISNNKGTTSLKIYISGFECPTLGSSDVFNGSYYVYNGTGKFSSSSGGAGTINGSQIPATGGLSQVSILGTVQPTAP